MDIFYKHIASLQKDLPPKSRMDYFYVGWMCFFGLKNLRCYLLPL